MPSKYQFKMYVYLTTFAIFLIVVLINGSDELNVENRGFESATVQGEMNFLSAERATKSMRELGTMDKINRYVLFLNWVPKSGAEMLIWMLQKLQGANSFRHVRLRGNTELSKVQQEKFVDNLYEKIKNEAVPLSFDQSIFFINYTLFDKQFPTHINIVKDPIDKLLLRISDNCSGKKCNVQQHVNELNIPYFCGQDPRCTEINNDWAFRVAKNNIEEYYPVVGVLENINATLYALEKNIPYYFRGALNAYQSILGVIPKNKQKINGDLSDNLKNIIYKEVQFYEWITQRLLKQNGEDKIS